MVLQKEMMTVVTMASQWEFVLGKPTALLSASSLGSNWVDHLAKLWEHTKAIKSVDDSVIETAPTKESLRGMTTVLLSQC